MPTAILNSAVSPNIIYAQNLISPFSVWYWRYWYTRKLYWVLLDSTLSTKPMTYDAVLKLDREIRQMKLPEVYYEEIAPGQPMRHLQRYVTQNYHPIGKNLALTVSGLTA